MNNNILLFLGAAGCFLCLGWSSAAAGDMKAVVTADFKLFHSHFGQTPFPSKAVTVDPEGVHLFFTSATQKPEYAALYSFFKLGGDCEVSARFDWRPVPVPRTGYGVSCGIRIETNDKKQSVSLARGIIPGKGDVYLVSIGTRRADKHVDYTNEPPFETSAKSGRLILLRQKKEIICLAADEAAEPKELCRLPFTDAAVQRVLIFADPGRSWRPLMRCSTQSPSLPMASSLPAPAGTGQFTFGTSERGSRRERWASTRARSGRWPFRGTGFSPAAVRTARPGYGASVATVRRPN
jgi:hypothetical protein